jgi:hypothetical protein
VTDGDRDDAVAGDGRDETEAERLDRNWTELLQELRVTQTGTQILTGFLLTIPFQQRFTALADVQLTIYLVLVGFAVLATVLALTPVTLHRALFRTGQKAKIVRWSNRLLIAALVCVGMTIAGTTSLIFGIVVGAAGGIVAGVTTFALCALAWVSLPALTRRRERD